MITDEAVAFFHAYAGWSYDPDTETSEEGRLRCARALAEAEEFAVAHDWYVEWQRDHDAESSESIEEFKDWPQYMAGLMDADGDLIGSIGGVMFSGRGDENDDPYSRVVAAELALEARKEHESERPSFTCAECGTTDATTYVVTTLDPENPRETQTEVCRQCDDMLRLDGVSA